MDNQHRKISGYRDLNQEEINLMNEVKALGVVLEGTVGKVRAYLRKQANEAVSSNSEISRLKDAEPEKWLEAGTTSLQTGLMQLTRSVAQPTFF